MAAVGVHAAAKHLRPLHALAAEARGERLAEPQLGVGGPPAVAPAGLVQPVGMAVERGDERGDAGALLGRDRQDRHRPAIVPAPVAELGAQVGLGARRRLAVDLGHPGEYAYLLYALLS